MALEIIGALALSLLAIWLLFEPMLRPARPDLTALEPEAPEETRRGVALLALKEIEFDRETGKLSDTDYRMLKTRYGAEALAAMDAEAQTAPAKGAGDPEELVAARLQLLRSAHSTGPPTPAVCRSCGPRPETDAAFCSSCGTALAAAGYCSQCGAALPPGSRFCAGCGSRVAA